MANTNLLKTVVEKELAENFCIKYELEQLTLPQKQMHNIFSNMEPDLIGINRNQKTLYLGEITTSGFMGQRGRDYHVGAVKKVAEAFSKFYLFKDDEKNIIRSISNYIPLAEVYNLKCYFIVPEGSKFLNALGYRTKLFEKGYMELEKIKLSKETEDKMIEVLIESKNENKQL
ncbi:hypothetical protein [Clostridium sp. CF012]|uniref:hypothetical protein n=1 Tax=Clostridium sp. CF012 TaxID=2843319 RepID=UPI001C0CCD2F|nr:hypothetical protein [Clostridium sp. CF012]MBU3145807.1 hypothetical protein [Clostridium sp. CF012]